jgi:hypothetical protein
MNGIVLFAVGAIRVELDEAGLSDIDDLGLEPPGSGLPTFRRIYKLLYSNIDI